LTATAFEKKAARENAPKRTEDNMEKGANVNERWE